MLLTYCQWKNMVLNGSMFPTTLVNNAHRLTKMSVESNNKTITEIRNGYTAEYVLSLISIDRIPHLHHDGTRKDWHKLTVLVGTHVVGFINYPNNDVVSDKPSYYLASVAGYREVSQAHWNKTIRRNILTGV